MSLKQDLETIDARSKEILENCNASLTEANVTPVANYGELPDRITGAWNYQYDRGFDTGHSNAGDEILERCNAMLSEYEAQAGNTDDLPSAIKTAVMNEATQAYRGGEVSGRNTAVEVFNDATDKYGFTDHISDIWSFSDRMDEVYGVGVEAGKAEGGATEEQSELIQYGQSLFAMFENITFPENTEIVLTMPNFLNRMDSCFRAAQNLKKITLVCEDWKGDANGVYAPQAFNTMTSGLEVVDLSQFKVIYRQINLLFNSNSGLREIIGELDFSLSTNNSNFLSGCSMLEEIRFAVGCLKVSTNFSPCSKLSDAAIQSIIDGLTDLTGQTAQTLTLHATVKAKLTEEQIAQITAKNWTLA